MPRRKRSLLIETNKGWPKLERAQAKQTETSHLAVPVRCHTTGSGSRPPALIQCRPRPRTGPPEPRSFVRLVCHSFFQGELIRFHSIRRLRHNNNKDRRLVSISPVSRLICRLVMKRARISRDTRHNGSHQFHCLFVLYWPLIPPNSEEFKLLFRRAQQWGPQTRAQRERGREVDQRYRLL